MGDPVLGLVFDMGLRVGPRFPRLGEPGEAASVTGKFLKPALGARRSIGALLLLPFLGESCAAMLYCPYGFVSEVWMVMPVGVLGAAAAGLIAFPNV